MRNDLRGWYKLRWKILERDKYTCQYCGQSAPDAKLEVDHIIPLADGGTDDEDNLNTSCWACNRGKSGLRQSIVLAKNRRKYWEAVSRKPSEGRTRIFELLKSEGVKLKVLDISRLLDLNPDLVRAWLSRLKAKNLVENPSRGLWKAK